MYSALTVDFTLRFAEDNIEECSVFVFSFVASFVRVLVGPETLGHNLYDEDPLDFSKAFIYG